MNKRNYLNKLIVSLTATLFVCNIDTANACTNIMVTKGASVDGSTMVSYSADSHTRFGFLNFTPAATHPKGAMRKIYEWGKGKYLGEIPQAEKTYSVVGNMNEYQLAIAESTFEGRTELIDPDGIIDYGSLIYIALERTKTAREAIELMGQLVEEYGYASSGESFSIADKNEVWYMEIIGKGKGNKGAVWVALRVPDGYISSHANHARITTFPLNDPENCMYSEDVISFAKEKGYYKGSDKKFSFSDAYAPLNFSAMRGCEARVWAVYNMFAPGMDKYLDYAMGHNPKNRLPLWIKPSRKLSISDVATAMRDHYEGTPMDMTTDFGAGGEACPYRWRPMNIEVDGKKYVNERAIATQQTGFWFVSQSRSWLPDEIGGVFWFSVDDASTAPLTPFYSSILACSPHYSEDNGSMIEYSRTSAFWLFNRVAQFAYLRYSTVGKAVQDSAKSFEQKCYTTATGVEAAALEIYKKSPQKAREFLTSYSLARASELFERWTALDEYLMVKYIDGNVKKEKDGKFLTNGNSDNIPAMPDFPGYNEAWKRAVVENNGKTLLIPTNDKK